MRGVRVLWWLAWVGVTLAVSACRSAAPAAGEGIRPAQGCPAKFFPVQHVTQAIPAQGAVPCLSPLEDPADGTILYLVRSAGGLGDYDVPTGRYGVGAHELLRIDCATGAAVGIVPRR